MPHSKKTLREWLRKKRAALREKGICPNCMSRPKAEGRVHCEPCLVSHRERDKRLRSRTIPARRELGLCVRCGAEAIEGRRMCGYHAEGICERNAARFARWQEEGRCLQCGRDPEPGKTRCRPCQDWQNAYLREWRKQKRLAAQAGVVTLRVTPKKKTVKKAG